MSRTISKIIVSTINTLMLPLSRRQGRRTIARVINGLGQDSLEGYVAIDRVSGGAVKLVDRMEFSFNNFTAIKAWDK